MRILAVIWMTMMLAACAANPRIVSSNEKTVVIKTNHMDAATAKAGEECAKYGKRARFYRSDSDEYIHFFDCV